MPTNMSICSEGVARFLIPPSYYFVRHPRPVAIYPDESHEDFQIVASHQRAVNPPSTIRLCPVTKDALPEQSHKTALATSSTRPMRPMG
jgi:hypothetical protein